MKNNNKISAALKSLAATVAAAATMVALFFGLDMVNKTWGVNAVIAIVLTFVAIAIFGCLYEYYKEAGRESNNQNQ